MFCGGRYQPGWYWDLLGSGRYQPGCHYFLKSEKTPALLYVGQGPAYRQALVLYLVATNVPKFKIFKNK
jgi:hypothetical protein